MTARSLPVVAGRHPEDGWTLAEPLPMSPRTRRVLAGVIRAVCPAEPAVPELERRMEEHVRRMLRYMPRAVVLGFILTLYALDWAPLWRFKAWRRLGRLDKERAELLLTELGESPWPLLRMIVLGPRGLILSTYFDQDEVHAAMGYAPLPFLQERVALRHRLLAGAPYTDADLIGAGHLDKQGGVSSLEQTTQEKPAP